MSREQATERVERNPFYVLELPSTCSRIEAERRGQKLMAMLELGLESAATYQTPLGPRPRSLERVRQALAEIRDPKKRLSHELWFVGTERLVIDDEPRRSAQPEEVRWHGATRAHRWRSK